MKQWLKAKAKTLRALPPTAPLPAATPGLGIHAQRVTKHFGPRRVLEDMELTLEPGHFLAIVGKSGCGKSTFLRLLAGLETAEAGTLRLEGADRQGASTEDVRIMYQDARLLPWRKVAENVALGLPGSRVERRALALEALEQVGLADRADEWPGVLSGGQRQRVALARALAHRPRLLLLDEPLGALDALTRIEMQRLIEHLWQKHRFTAVLVTHDVAEAVALADRVVLMEAGGITQAVEVALPRPRPRACAAVAELEGQVLARLLNDPEGAKSDTALRAVA
ncbi:MAG: ATP-binding cassette domain-containing protein [Zoogloeaceae bacterium]|jgi:sulfonate transport system ATP-binding protein|nr:ATP-binding cassette domain-containing protein [Zoogloeaceae bacterium]